MKKYLSLTLLVFTILFLSYVNQTQALMACHTWNPNSFWNDVVSLKYSDCCEMYPQHNPSCSANVGSCKTTNECFKFMDATECNMEWWTWYSSSTCTNTQDTTTWCSIANGTGKEVKNYGKHWAPYWEVRAWDIAWVDVCNPMPTVWTSCANILDSCKKDNVTTRYLECERYDLWTTSCAVDTCNPWFVQDWNKCVAWPEKGVCSTTSQSCTTWNYVDVTNTATEYKWQCSGLNWGQNSSCSLNIPVTPQAWTCSATHYGCSLWTSTNNINGSTQWTWDCQWTNWWATTSCTEDKDLTVVPPVVLGDWPINWATSSANDDSKFAWMSNEAKYVLEWCTPHKIELDWNPTAECMTKYFTSESGKAVLPINWWTDNLLSITDNMWFEIRWEWVLYIHTFAKDYADNISIKKFIYKVDKTAPKFWDFVFTEVSGNQYMNIEKYDKSKNANKIPDNLGILHMSSQDDWDTFPLINTYTKITKEENPYTQDENNIFKIRYKQSWLWVTSPVINVALSWATDTFWWTAHFNYVSRANKIDFYKWSTVSWWVNDFHETKTINLSQRLTNKNEVDINTFNFSKGWTASSRLTWDDWTFINVRLTDNAWNYSEKAFYVYRDETPPVVIGPTGFQFKFMDGDDLRLSDWNSKMILANSSTSIKYDWWTANDHMAPNIVLKTEKHDNINFPTTYQSATLANANNWDTSGQAFNFEKVDNDPNSWNYRYYSTKFETPGIYETPGVLGNKICDVAWNCVNWEDVFKNFQVMANVIDKDKSDININIPTKAIANNPANPLVDTYKITYKLKDEFNNGIKNVVMWGNQIKTVSTELDFYNGLSGSLVSSWTLVNPDAITLTWDIFTQEPVVLKEANSPSDGEFNLEISSRVPTVWWYPYLQNSARLELQWVTNKVVNSNTSNIHNPLDENDTVIFSWDKIVDIKSNIEEKKSNRYNLDTTSIVDYGKILSPLTYSNSLNNAITSTFNFEFASPFIYHAKDFNILRDGIDSQHTKYMVDNGSWMWNYNILERYFDADDVSSNTRADFYVNNILNNIFTTISWNNINNSFLAKYTAKTGSNFDKWWYISYIWYNAWSTNGYTYIPSISRWVAANIIWEEPKASANFPNVSSSGGINFLTQDIAITGLVNKIDWLVNTTTQEWLASLDLDRPYTRAELLEKLKKKIFTVNKIWNWCAWTSTDLEETVWNYTSCTFNINWEIITFYDWDVIIDCGRTCNVNDKRSVIVKNWRVTINSNINTDWWNGQFFIASITDKWLENVNISNGTDHEISTWKQKWWMSIDENVTNIDAFLLSQWPLVSSYLWDVMINYSNIDRLLNQLHIYGSVFSLNTISWDKTKTCPYIEQNCNNFDTAKIYDLSFLRRYALVDAGNFNWVSDVDVPFSPNLDYTDVTTVTTKSSWWYTYSWNWNKNESDIWLRTAKPEHVKSPVIIERDNRWTTSPSFFAKD